MKLDMQCYQYGVRRVGLTTYEFSVQEFDIDFLCYKIKSMIFKCFSFMRSGNLIASYQIYRTFQRPRTFSCQRLVMITQSFMQQYYFHIIYGLHELVLSLSYKIAAPQLSTRANQWALNAECWMDPELVLLRMQQMFVGVVFFFCQFLMQGCII